MLIVPEVQTRQNNNIDTTFSVKLQESIMRNLAQEGDCGFQVQSSNLILEFLLEAACTSKK